LLDEILAGVIRVRRNALFRRIGDFPTWIHRRL
jgi:hypothetical protein